MNENQQPTGIEALVCRDIAARQKLGIQKYGTTVADNPLTQLEWLRHAYFESLDLPIYLRRLIDKIEKDQLAELRAAQAAGKIIQTNFGCNPDNWQDCPFVLNFEGPLHCYRIKPLCCDASGKFSGS